MKNDIYGLFIKGTDEEVREYDDLTTEEVNTIMNRFRNDRNTGKKNIKKKARPGIALIIAAASAACIGTTAFAAERLGVFDMLKGVHDRTVTDEAGNEFQVEKNDRLDYDRLDGAANVLEQPVISENENITLSADSVYCDGKKLIIGITGSLADGNAEKYGYIDLWDFDIEVGGVMYHHVSDAYPDGEIRDNYGYMVLDEGAENSFTGSLTCNISAIGLTEATDITVHFDDVACSEMYFTSKTYIDAAQLNVPVTEIAEVKEVNISYEEDGYTFSINEVSPVTVYGEYIAPYVHTAPDHDIYVDVFDEKGSSMTCINGEWLDDHMTAFEFKTPDTDSIIVRFYDKCHTEADGSPLLVKEMNIDIK